VAEKFGEMVLVEATPAEFRELGRIKALTEGNKTWNNPAVAHGRIYIRNAEQMACFDLTGR
jgi:outer membrane protein assembly factor BamB